MKVPEAYDPNPSCMLCSRNMTQVHRILPSQKQRPNLPRTQGTKLRTNLNGNQSPIANCNCKDLSIFRDLNRNPKSKNKRLQRQGSAYRVRPLCSSKQRVRLTAILCCEAALPRYRGAIDTRNRYVLKDLAVFFRLFAAMPLLRSLL